MPHQEWTKCYGDVEVGEIILKRFPGGAAFEMGFGELVWFNKQRCTEGLSKHKE